MINKVTLIELHNDVFKRSTLISIPGLKSFFKFPNSDYTTWEVFSTIVRDALDKFEYYYPLSLVQKFYLEVNNETRKAYIKGNFEAYLNGIVTEDSICIVPSSIQGLAYSAYASSVYPLRNFRYEIPEFSDFWYPTRTYWANTLCRRPFIEDYDNISKDPTEKCAIYYLTKNASSDYTIFRDQLYVSLCRFIINLRKNMELSELPINLFQGLEDDMSRIESQLENIYSNALTSSSWLI